MTDEITFDEEPDLPTVIVDAPTTNTPIGKIVWLDKSSQPAWTFEVRVRDENITQDLIAHHRVVTEQNESPSFVRDFLTTSGTELRDLKITINSESLRVGECHQLQLAVSPAFFTGTQPAFFDAVPPGRELDRAYATWWLWEGPGDMEATVDDKARLTQTCKAIMLAPTISGSAP